VADTLPRVGTVRDRGDVLGFGVPAALFLAGVAYLGITNGHRFIDNDFFAFMYCLAGVGFASVPLLVWCRGGGRFADPGLVRSAWLPWLFTTGQGVAYSSPRSDANVFVLGFGWGAFIYAGMAALYFLGCALWGVGDHLAASGIGSTSPETPAAGFPRPQAADISAHTERADRLAFDNRARPGHSAGPSLHPSNTANPCYEAWLQQSLCDLDRALTDQEQSLWADALAEEVRSTYPGVHVSLTISRGYLLLYLIVIPESERGIGLGTRVMEHLVSAADLRGVAMTLNPTDTFGSAPDRLHAFYRRFGFITNKWRGEIGAAYEGMVRVPRNSSAEADNPACSGSCCKESTS
jgi:GNAT superfamily N-acetyltransferase